MLEKKHRTFLKKCIHGSNLIPCCLNSSSLWPFKSVNLQYVCTIKHQTNCSGQHHHTNTSTDRVISTPRHNKRVLLLPLGYNRQVFRPLRQVQTSLCHVFKHEMQPELRRWGPTERQPLKCLHLTWSMEVSSCINKIPMATKCGWR